MDRLPLIAGTTTEQYCTGLPGLQWSTVEDGLCSLSNSPTTPELVETLKAIPRIDCREFPEDVSVLKTILAANHFGQQESIP